MEETTFSQPEIVDIACRSCGNSSLHKVLSLGNAPAVNTLLNQAQVRQSEPTWPLDLMWCSECSLVQIIDALPADTACRDVAYFASFSETLVRHAQEIAADLTGALKLNSQSLVIEIGSNDGYLLQWYQRAGVPVLGIESAKNIARMAEVQKGIPTITESFAVALARRLKKENRQADVVHINNVLTREANLNEVAAGLKLLIKPDGVVIAEVPYLKDLIDRFEFDTINHGTLNYFSLTALDRLFRRHGLMVSEVETLSIHGGSLRLYVRHLASGRPAMSVVRMLAHEDEWAYRAAYYREFGQRVEHVRADLVTMLTKLKAQRKRIAVYGASAKGSALLNYLGIGPETLDYVVDRNTLKHGQFIPGTHLKICSPDHLLKDKPDYCLLLSWFAADDILAQQQTYREQGGKFIIPMPNIRVA